MRNAEIRLARVLAFAICLLVPAQLWAQDDAPQLYVNAHDDHVMLIWNLPTWPDDTVGFYVRYRDTSSASWQPLNSQPIEPGMWLTKDLSNVEPDPQERDQLSLMLQEMLSAGEASEVSADVFRSTVSSNAAILKALRREILSEPRRALVIGLGLIDRGATDQSSREYGLFPLRSSAVIDDEPIATVSLSMFSADDDRLRASNLAATQRIVGKHLSWQFSEENAQAMSVFAFHVYRADAGSSKFDLISMDGAISAPPASEESRFFDFLDRTAMSDVSYRYAVAPVNVFGTELPTRTVLDDSTNRAAVEFVFSLVEAVQRDGAILITWEVDAETADRAQNYQVERMTFPDGEFEKVSNPIASSGRSIEDTDDKVPGSVFGYRVMATGQAAGPWYSPMTTVLINDMRVPAKPVELTASCTDVGEKRVIRLRWANALTQDSVSVGYVVYADKAHEGIVERQASIPLLTTAAYDLEVPSLVSRSFTVGVAARSRSGVEGLREEASCNVKGLLPEAVTDLSISQDETTNLTVVEWRYQSSTTPRGFRIFVNRQIVAEERVLGGDARSFQFQPQGDPLTIEIVAVSFDGRTSPTKSLTLPAAIEDPAAGENL